MGIVALTHIQEPGNAVDIPQLLFIEFEFATG
jgi:hypothetical protein